MTWLNISDFIQVQNLPQHLKDELEEMAQQEEAERRQREIDRNTCKVRDGKRQAKRSLMS